MLALSISTRVPEIAGEEIENVKSIDERSELSMPSITIDPLLPAELTPKSILVESIPVVTSTPAVLSKLDLAYPSGKVSVLITILSIAASKLVKKRSIGPFRRKELDEKLKNKEYGILARAGFNYGLSKKLLYDLSAKEIEDIINNYN